MKITILASLIAVASPSLAAPVSDPGERAIVKYQLARDILYSCDRVVFVQIGADVPIEYCATVVDALRKTCPPTLRKVDCRMGAKTSAVLTPAGVLQFIFGPDLDK